MLTLSVVVTATIQLLLWRDRKKEEKQVEDDTPVVDGLEPIGQA